MKKWIFIGAGVVVLLGLIIGVIVSLRDTGPKYYKPDTRPPNFDMHRSQQSLDWDGTYAGVLPCADCNGIDTTLTLKRDETYVLQTRYLGKSDKKITQTGKFEWRNSGSDIALKTQNAEQLYKVGEERLFHLDQNGDRITGVLADQYVLIKMLPAALVETYWELVDLNGAPVPPSSRHPHIILNVLDKRVTGSGGCNRLSGTYETTGQNGVTFSKVAATRMACPNGMGAEDAFLKILARANAYKLNGDTLELRDKNSILARFRAVYGR